MSMETKVPPGEKHEACIRVPIHEVQAGSLLYYRFWVYEGENVSFKVIAPRGLVAETLEKDTYAPC